MKFSFALLLVLSHSGLALGSLAMPRNCQYSDAVYNSDLALMQQPAPTRFRLMAARWVEIIEASRGAECTGTVTVAFNGHEFFQAGFTDDPGLAELIPLISSWTGLSLASSFDLTEFLVIFLGILIGYAGYWHLCPRTRWHGLAVFLGIGMLEAKVADVYIFQLSPLLAGFPWLVYLAFVYNFFAFSVCTALLVFFSFCCSLLRGGTTLICIAFAIALVLARFPFRKACILMLVIILSCAPCLFTIHRLIAHRNMVLAALGKTPTGVNSHPIWHSIYLGLGFVPNSEVPAFRDRLAADRVRSIDPTAAYTSERYEAILRGEVLRIATQAPWVLLENLAVKIGLVSMLASILLYPSRHSLFARKDKLWVDVAFSLAILLGASGPILVAPLPQYLLTFCGLTALFSSVAYCRKARLSP